MAAVEPTLDDGAVMDFVASGYVLLEGVIDDSFNQRCDDLNPGNIDAFIASDAFTDTVLLHPQVAGVARSLLGEDFLVPAGGHHHVFEKPHLGQTWHSDGLSGSGYDVTEFIDLVLGDDPLKHAPSFSAQLIYMCLRCVHLLFRVQIPGCFVILPLELQHILLVHFERDCDVFDGRLKDFDLSKVGDTQTELMRIAQQAECHRLESHGLGDHRIDGEHVGAGRRYAQLH
jgi:hypothetical protein